jgi:hypothetical protein
MAKPAHRRGSYHVTAKRVREAAYANPGTTCWRCGLPLDAKPGDTWDAGHLRDGDPTSPLLPEHSSCNRSAGATMGNRQRGRRTTMRW